MTDIQQARDVLAFWRMDTTPGPWRVSNSGNWVTSDVDVIARAGGDSALIVGTAGNPDLLDALDRMLERAAGQAQRGYQGGWNGEMDSLAAAIIAADARMTS